MVEYWSDGGMGEWSDGVTKNEKTPNTPIPQYSNIPIFHPSNTPFGRFVAVKAIYLVNRMAKCVQTASG
ncbi:MAG: hypothetical protein AB1696_02660, partial [Planctomycetota bacterium]